MVMTGVIIYAALYFLCVVDARYCTTRGCSCPIAEIFSLGYGTGIFYSNIRLVSVSVACLFYQVVQKYLRTNFCSTCYPLLEMEYFTVCVIAIKGLCLCM